MVDYKIYAPDMDKIKANSKGRKHTILEEIEILRNGDDIDSLLEPATIRLVKAATDHKNCTESNCLSQRNHIYNINKLFLFATEVLNSEDKAEIWMYQQIRALNWARPIDHLDTAVGIRWVENILTNLKYGNYS